MSVGADIQDRAVAGRAVAAPGFERLEKLYVARGFTDLTATLYPEARHELLNETNRDEVTADLRQWLDRVTGA